MSKDKKSAIEKDSKIKDGLLPSDSYFVELERKLLSSSQNAQASKIEDGLNAGEEYFTQLSEKLTSQISIRKQKPSRIVQLQRWAVAASILLLVALGGVYLNGLIQSNQPAENENVTYNSIEVSSSTAESYVENRIYFMSEAELELLLDNDIQSIESELQIADEDLEEYLMIYNN